KRPVYALLGPDRDVQPALDAFRPPAAHRVPFACVAGAPAPAIAPRIPAAPTAWTNSRRSTGDPGSYWSLVRLLAMVIVLFEGSLEGPARAGERETHRPALTAGRASRRPTCAGARRRSSRRHGRRARSSAQSGCRC